MRQDKSIQQATEALMSEERRMAEAVRRGDMAGYRYFTDRHARRVQQLVASMVDDERDVEELTQDVFVRAFENIHRFDPQRASFGTWVSRIAYNAAVSSLRRARPHLRPLEEAADICPAPESELQEQLDEAIARLHPRERLLLHLHYFEERSLGEMESIVGVSTTALAGRLARIRKKLERLMRITPN